jgi:hypothetical protein
MTQLNLIAMDAETGGFSASQNPLLSLALLHVNGDAIQVRFIPPQDTWLEIPVPEHQTRAVNKKTIANWMNVHTGQLVPVSDTKPTCMITAGAAEVNGFITVTDSGWDTSGVSTWGTVSYEDGQKQLVDWLLARRAVAIVGHNAGFDRKFVDRWLPRLGDYLPPSTCDTMLMFKARKTEESASLGNLCKLAGYDPSAVGESLHTALGDCRATLAVYRWLVGAA